LGFGIFLLRFAPEKFCVGARVDDGLAVPDLDDLGRQLFDEVPIV